MELSWTTFVLEIINFLVLVWILKRFFYKPVLDVIARRRAAIERTLAEARERDEQAQALKEQYRNRLADWEREKAAAHETLRHEIESERERLMSALMRSLDQEREKSRVLEERRRHEALLRAEEQALQHGSRFAGRLLERLTSPELEARLVQWVLDELAQLPPERVDALRAAWHQGTEPINVSSAFPLNQDMRAQLHARGAELLGADRGEWNFREDPALIAGLRISVGSWLLRANLQDELKFFTETTDGTN